MHSLSRPPTRHSAHLYLLRQLMYHSCISAQDIIFELNRFLKSHPDRIEDTLSTFCVFAPEIEHNDKPLFDSILTQFKTMCTGKYAGYLPPELDLFIDQLESLRANNWKLLIQRADYGFNNDPISITLKDDDIETLREMSKSPYFDKNQRIHPSVFERCMFLWNEPTLLQFAAFHGAVNCFKYLIELGSDLTILSRNNFDVSCFAVAGGNLNIIKILEEKGITFKDAIQISAAMHQHNIFHWLYKNKCPNGLTDIGSELDSVLHAAAGANNTRLMLFCIGKKVDVNIKGRTLLSPLHIATERSRMDSISLLLAHKGLNINACDENEETALHVAAENGRYKPMKLLVSHEDINVNSRDKFICLNFLVFF
ncbi:ankyrin repeat protein [Histomonas meleagridis]|uniref:ankyrin repeat protein n=1 Tax=Histomonas meleagridis TaxID=135588 RepID=UPI00355A2885|nr:ankyrin repeat protein [Histomonas meleagridis]KAH0799332.1 ankyrin repeat protein [Histomonas meleagridis]